MITRQIIKLNMYLAIRNFAIINEKIANSIPKFWESYQLLLKIIQEIQLADKKQGMDRTGLTSDKNKLKKLLIDTAIKYSNKLSILAKISNNDTLLKEIKITESDLSKLSAVTVAAKAQLVFDKTEANLEKLAEQGVTAETQKKFMEIINAYNDALSMPRTGRVERKQETQKLPVLFAAADNQVSIMDMAATSAKRDYPDFYNGYKNSRQIVDSGSGSLALKVSAKAAGSGEPVKGALFTFRPDSTLIQSTNGNYEIKKKTTEKGNFQLKSLAPGSYKVSITGAGYKEKEISVNVVDGKRNELIVELEKV